MRQLFLCIALVAANLSVSTAQITTSYSLDPDFGLNGKRIFGFAGSSNDQPMMLTSLADGSILVGGTTSLSDNGGQISMAKVEADGTPVTTFGVGGKVEYRSTLRSYANDWAIQPDGKIVVAGVYWESNAGSGITPGVYRFNANGSIDTTFANKGTFFKRFDPTSGGSLHGVHLLADGRIVVVGFSRGNINGGRNALGLMRLMPDGSLDPTFGTNGTLQIGSVNGTYIGSLLQGRNELIVAFCYQKVGGSEQYYIARIDSAGNVLRDAEGLADATFLPGKTFSMLQQTDGKVVIIGTNTGASPLSMMQVVRIDTSRLRRDSTFGTAGVARFGSGTVDVSGLGGCIMPDGSIMVGGTWTEGSGLSAIGKLTSNGQVVESFGTQGVIRLDLNGNTGTQSVVRLMPAGGTSLLGLASDASSGGGDMVLFRMTEVTVGVNEEHSPAASIVVGSTEAPSLEVTTTQAGTIHISMYDLAGRIVISQTMEVSAGRHHVPMLTVPSGAYILNVNTPTWSRTLPFMVAR